MADNNSPPNIILMIADDLGFGDLGCYGSNIATPRLDGMAAEGVRFRNFTSASAVCSPARASLLTGRYPTRVGVPGVLWPYCGKGLADSETTIAQMLKPGGYSTMCIGKWHLGSEPQYLPTNRGFDDYLGIPYSSDMDPLPLLRRAAVVEQPTNLNTLVARYTDEAVKFINRSTGNPFFLYMAYGTPHLPLVASQQFRGRSGLGLYGDAVQEIDWSAGRILDAVSASGLDGNTLVIFTSDHGAWYQGSVGKLHGMKAETFEGGVRVPFIARFPGRIPAGLLSGAVASSMDVLPTLARLTGAGLPGQPLDGIDIWPLMTGDRGESNRDVLLYFDQWHIQCARLGKWKLHVARYNTPPWTPDPKPGRFNLPLPQPELYDLEADPEESYDVSADNQMIVAYIRARIEALVPTFPQDVGDAWRNTMQTPVDYTPPGAWPVRRTG